MKGHWLEPAIHFRSVLAVLGLVAAARSLSLQAQSPQVPPNAAYSLSGIVVDEKQAPVVSAELTISRDGQNLTLLRTNEKGAFSFAGQGRGSIQLVVRRLGFNPHTTTVDLDRRADAEILRIVLETVPSEVEPVVVTTDGGRLELFRQHRRENPFGKFFDRGEIEQSRVRLTSDLFRSVPGASLRPSRRYGNMIRLRGCQPQVWIDRVPVRDVELDEVTTPEEIAGIEIYSSSSSVPAQFMDRGGRSCGAIVVWTRIN